MSFELPEPSELVAALAGKAEDAFESKGSEWFNEMLDQGRKMAYSELTDPELKAGATAMLGKLEDGKAPFLRLSAYGLAQIVGYFGSDEEEKAHNVYIATQATYAERRAWMQEGGDFAQKDREERDAAWSAVEDVLKEVGAVGLKILVKLLMAQLGL